METLRLPHWRLGANTCKGKKEPAMVKQQGRGSLLLGTAFQKQLFKS